MRLCALWRFSAVCWSFFAPAQSLVANAAPTVTTAKSNAVTDELLFYRTDFPTTDISHLEMTLRRNGLGWGLVDKERFTFSLNADEMQALKDSVRLVDFFAQPS